MPTKKTRIRKSKKADKKSDRHLQPDAAMRRDLEADKREHAAEARKQADTDISKDADLSIHNPNDDLDEGETARLGEDETDIV